jgi:diphthamide synthase (EF-2-diphthine--ammonia ligase)
VSEPRIAAGPNTGSHSRPQVAAGPESGIASPWTMTASRRRMLVTWSGGLDSTYGLVRVLRETDDDIHVHHIHRFAPHDDKSDPAQSSQYEAAAVGRMLPIIRERYRDFTYSESLVDNTAFPQFAPDATTVLLFAGCVAKRLGFGAQDRILDVMNSDEDGDWGPASMSGILLRMNSLNVLKLVSRTDAVPALHTYDGIPSKAEEVAYLPRDLVDMNASCRAPRLVGGAWRNCGICRKCRSFARMGVGLPGDAEDAESLRQEADRARSAEPKREVEVRPFGARKHLVMWSGGDRSTAALVRLLEQPDEPVRVHHVLSSGRLDRRPDEFSFGGHRTDEVEARLVEIRRRYRPFKMTISAIGPNRVVSNTHPANVIAYFAAQAAMSWRMQSLDQIVLGAWGDRSGDGDSRPALYRSGELLAPQMLKAIMRSEDGPQFVLGGSR